MPTIHEIETELLSPPPRRITRNTDTWDRTTLSFEKAQLILIPFIIVGLALILSLLDRLLLPHAGVTTPYVITGQNPRGEAPPIYHTDEIGGMLFICLLWNGVTGLLAGSYFFGPFLTRRIYREGTPVIATIIGKKMSEGESAPTYSIKYEFIPTDVRGHGASIVNHVYNISSVCWDEITSGDQCTVLYLPNRPRMNVLYRYGGYRVIG